MPVYCKVKCEWNDFNEKTGSGICTLSAVEIEANGMCHTYSITKYVENLTEG